MREMKYSGVEWIGDIPEEWEVKPIRNILIERNEKNRELSITTILSLSAREGVSLYNSETHTGNKPREDLSDYKIVRKGDIVVNSMNILSGSVGISEYEGVVSPVYYIYYPRTNNNIRYFHLLFQCFEFQRSLRGLGNGILIRETESGSLNTIRIRIPSKKLGLQEFPYPSEKEQQAIADILDRKCTQIDALIANEEQQIAKLKAYKQSVITETVTKGLNPDVPMKDSGVEWIGEIPEHWEVLQLSSLVTERKHKNTNMQETNLLSLSYGKIIRKDIKTKDGLLPDNFEGYNIVECGDIVLRLTDLQNDHKSLRTGLCKERGIITSAYVTLANRGKTVISTYLNYLLHTFDVYKGFYGMGAGVRQGLNFEGVKKILLSVPQINEQQQIADYLDQKCEQIDRLIAIKQQKIEKIQQYKKSVIYEYVTGKRESVDTNVVFFNPLTAKALLLCKIIDFLGDQLRGRIQALKCLFLIEDCVGINFNTQYFRFKHGPYTPDIVNIEKCCMENEWLTVSIVNNHYEYHIGNNHCYYSDKYDKIFGTNNSEIEKVLSFIKGMKTSEVERVATLFAVWNDMIIAGTNSPSDSEIIFEVRNNWTPNKANSPVSTWQNTLDKMRKAGITPKGYGLHTMKKENENEQL